MSEIPTYNSAQIGINPLNSFLEEGTIFIMPTAHCANEMISREIMLPCFNPITKVRGLLGTWYLVLSTLEANTRFQGFDFGNTIVVQDMSIAS
ncbi:hypothetical protein [Sphaerospermopsis aphanizomenoides]|uniref:hypothetical protein n=1 Tax=Sphaerospermopsis aphanizomenoides TaxID=459663 RepID=UPI001F46E853|nr:hypothetical protein [Sphaerospermopsis aphanizomenoides]